MDAISREKMQQMDKTAINEFLIPGLILMENAGKETTREILKENPKKVGIFCGKGNNGGDGFVIARHLDNVGVDIQVVLFGDPATLKGDALTNYKIIEKLNIPVLDQSEIQTVCASADILVDAIFGIGLSSEISGEIKEGIDSINQSGKPVIAVDIPSGIDADTGEVLGIAVKATKTVTMGATKLGLLAENAKQYVGEIVVADISLPKELYSTLNQ